jgi:hypothetical protein
MIYELRIDRGKVKLRKYYEQDGKKGDWVEISARCTANAREPSKRSTVRCMREMGHGGLHRYKHNDSIIEFPDSQAWFPHYSAENLR